MKKELQAFDFNKANKIKSAARSSEILILTKVNFIKKEFLIILI